MDIVRFKGGLGNQMFQYAFMEALRHRGREVYASLGGYNRKGLCRSFALEDAFPNTKIMEIEDRIFREIDQRWRDIKKDSSALDSFKIDLEKRFFYVEELDSVYDQRVFRTLNCCFVGYWQTEKYFIDIKEILKRKYSFNIQDDAVNKFADMLCDNFFSMHIRQGDYLKQPYREIYGGICTKQYYWNAMKYIKTRIPAAKFIIFSDANLQMGADFEKSNEVVILDKNVFNSYQDWYDLYFMTKCRGNIIANSSFSWWGAWLNNCPEKIVVAPKIWLNGKKTPDIWCDDWIRL